MRAEPSALAAVPRQSNVRSLSRIVEELVPEYLAARQGEIVAMSELLAAGDFERLRILGHSLKGSGGSFGFPELSARGAVLERHAERSDGAAFQLELQRLTDYLAELRSTRLSEGG